MSIQPKCTMKPETQLRALNKLREYVADDPIEAERLNPLLAAFDAGDMFAAFNLGAVVLDTYCACDCAIDELYQHCKAQSL